MGAANDRPGSQCGTRRLGKLHDADGLCLRRLANGARRTGRPGAADGRRRRGFLSRKDRDRTVLRGADPTQGDSPVRGAKERHFHSSDAGRGPVLSLEQQPDRRQMVTAEGAGNSLVYEKSKISTALILPNGDPVYLLLVQC